MSIEDRRKEDAPPDRDDDERMTRDAGGRWLPGHCPNPNGRPRKRSKQRLNMADLMHFKETLVDVAVGGEVQSMTREEALLAKIYEAAMKGKVSQQRFLYQQFELVTKRLARARLRYKQLAFDWIIDNPNLDDPGFKIPEEIMHELEELRDLLNHYFPGRYQSPPDDDSSEPHSPEDDDLDDAEDFEDADRDDTDESVEDDDA